MYIQNIQNYINIINTFFKLKYNKYILYTHNNVCVGINDINTVGKINNNFST